jgi:hypothetical protein
MIRRRAASCVLLCLAAFSCAPEGPVPAATSPEAARSAQRLLPTSDNGLAVRQWRVADDPAQIASALMRHADREVLDEPSRERMARNGFRLLRVRAEDLEALLADLGGATFNVDAWHGQAYDWRTVVNWPIETTGRAIAVDGRVRRFEGGRLELMIRAWTMLMEDGPYLRLQMLGQHDRSRPSRLDRMMGQRVFEGLRLPSLSLDLLLEAGWAYVLTCESPSVKWEPVEADAAAPEPTSGEMDEADETGERDGRPGGAGPDVLAPLTVGEVLFRVEAMPPAREMLVFVPRIPEALFPPELTAEPAGGGREVQP